MTIYSTLGQDRGCCGHRNLTPREACASVDRFRAEQQHRDDYSDGAVAVELDAQWKDGKPARWRHLNEDELTADVTPAPPPNG